MLSHPKLSWRKQISLYFYTKHSNKNILLVLISKKQCFTFSIQSTLDYSVNKVNNKYSVQIKRSFDQYIYILSSREQNFQQSLLILVTSEMIAFSIILVQCFSTFITHLVTYNCILAAPLDAKIGLKINKSNNWRHP